LAAVLKHGVIGHREKMKYNGKALRMKIYRFGGLVPLKKKIKIRNEQIVRLAFAESDRIDAKIFAAIKGENVAWCFYVTASSKRSRPHKTFKFIIVRKALLSRKEDKKAMNEALAFAREVAKGVGLHEFHGANDSYIFSRDQGSVSVAEIVTLLDDESEIEEGDEDFEDDEPDDD